MVPLVRRVVPLKSWQVIVAELVEVVKNAYKLRAHVPAIFRLEGKDDAGIPKLTVRVVDAETVIAEDPLEGV